MWGEMTLFTQRSNTDLGLGQGQTPCDTGLRVPSGWQNERFQNCKLVMDFH